MAVLRIRRGGIAVFFCLFLAACSGSTESTSREPDVILSGSVGDGPAVDATLRLTDAAGNLLEEHVSDELAGYELSVPGDTAMPVLIEATGGVDLVTGRPLDFSLLGAALDTGATTVNISPLTTLAIRAAQCSPAGLTADGLEQAWQRVHAKLGMGLDSDAMPDPMTAPVTRDNVEMVVLANEALGEAVRRAQQALAGAGSSVDGDAVVRQVACELMGVAQTADGETVEPRVMAAFKAAELTVRLETLAGRLEVDGTSATTRMNDAIRLVMRDFVDPSVRRVVPTQPMRQQTLALVSLFRELADSEPLMSLAAALDAAGTQSVQSVVDAALSAALHVDLQALTVNVALADDITLAELEARRDGQDDTPRPLVSLSADPGEVALGERVSLSWASSNAEQCVSSWAGVVGTEGVMDSSTLQTSTTFRMSCVGLGGTTGDTVSVLVGDTPLPEPEPEPEPLPEPEPEPEPQPEPLPSLSLAAADTTIPAGTSTTLTWTASNASTCLASNGWSGLKAVSDSQSTGALNATTTFRLACTGSGGTVSRSVTVQVESTEPEPEPPAPTVTLASSASVVIIGESVTLTWTSQNAASCEASGAWSGGKSTSGSQVVGPLDRNRTYRLTCTGAGGSVTGSVWVQAEPPEEPEPEPEPEPAPTVSLQAAASSVQHGASTQLSWSSSNATSCVAAGGWSGTRAISGSLSTGSLTGTTSFQLTCSGPGGNASDSVTVQVAAPDPSVSLNASAAVVDEGDTVQLTWTSSQADSCQAGLGWSGTRAVSGTQQVGPLDSRTSFRLTCSRGGVNASTTISVSVNESVALQWEPPTENVDGTALTDLAGYRVYYGTASGDYTEEVPVSSSGATSTSLTLPSGSYYFVMTAIDAEGNESAYSNEVVKTVD